MSNSPQPEKSETGLEALIAVLPSLPLPVALFSRQGSLLAAAEPFFAQVHRGWGLESTEVRLPDLLGGEQAARELTSHLREDASISGRAVELTPASGGQAPILTWISPLTEGERTFFLLLVDGQGAVGSNWREVAESLPVGLLIADSRGRLVVFNPALADLLDLAASDRLGVSSEDFIQVLAARALEPTVAEGSLLQAMDNVAEKPEVGIALSGEPTRHLEVSFFPLQDAASDDLDWGALVTDVTETRDQLDWKLELLSLLAHDIRTPLATMKGHATALLANYRRWSDSMVLEFLEALDRGTDQLVRQVDRSLALTRLEAGRMGLRPAAVAPQRLVKGALERAANALGNHTVEQDLPDNLPDVRVDPARSEEVLVNLLENAAHFSPASSGIRIGGRSEQAMVTLFVEDGGPGVPAAQRDNIFEKHGQTDWEEETRTGLGLFISRKIVEAHGGRIWLESPLTAGEGGARFLFSLPVMPEQPDAASASLTQEPRAADGQTVLLVEAEAELQSLLRTVIEGGGFHVVLAPDGPTALDSLAGHQPDLILLDLMLPRMAGLSVCRALRRWSAVPIMVLTSKTAPEDLLEAIDAGADDYLTRPFQPAELLTRLRALQRRAERSDGGQRTARLGGEGLTIDEKRMVVLREGEPVALTPTEFELLLYLARNQGQVLTHDQLIDHLWPAGEGGRHQLFVHINRLRSKIEEEPKDPRYVVTRWGVGYSFLPLTREGR